jgi:hypothetical protein
MIWVFLHKVFTNKNIWQMNSWMNLCFVTKKREKCEHFDSLEEICILHNINEYFECWLMCIKALNKSLYLYWLDFRLNKNFEFKHIFNDSYCYIQCIREKNLYIYCFVWSLEWIWTFILSISLNGIFFQDFSSTK